MTGLRNTKRCMTTWYGDCGVSIVNEHICARPPGHPQPCMCYCGERPSEDGQEQLILGARARRLYAIHEQAEAARRARAGGAA